MSSEIIVAIEHYNASVIINRSSVNTMVMNSGEWSLVRSGWKKLILVRECKVKNFVVKQLSEGTSFSFHIIIQLWSFEFYYALILIVQNETGSIYFFI